MFMTSFTHPNTLTHTQTFYREHTESLWSFFSYSNNQHFLVCIYSKLFSFIAFKIQVIPYFWLYSFSLCSLSTVSSKFNSQTKDKYVNVYDMNSSCNMIVHSLHTISAGPRAAQSVNNVLTCLFKHSAHLMA